MANFEITNNGAPTNPNSYNITVNPPICSFPPNRICYIIAADNGVGKPVIVNSLIGEILGTLNTRTDSARVKLKP